MSWGLISEMGHVGIQTTDLDASIWDATQLLGLRVTEQSGDAAYLEEPAHMPADFASREHRPRAVADYIAGMTDRFAAREHERLTGLRLLA